MDDTIIHPSIDELDIKDLRKKTIYEVRTKDNWFLTITRYEPLKQPWKQALYKYPLLLVHGLAQNRHAWTAGEFVKNMLYFGADIHVLELRGHGKSGIQTQLQMQKKFKHPLPKDLKYKWSIDSYFLYDIPTAIQAVKKRTGHDNIFYCGHSLGGILGYGLAGLRNDIMGLITIGSPSDPGKGFFLIRLAAFLEPFASFYLDRFLDLVNITNRLVYLLKKQLTRNFILRKIIEKKFKYDLNPPKKLVFNVLPSDEILKFIAKSLSFSNSKILERLPSSFPKLWNPTKVALEDLKWLLHNGAEKESRKVLEQFAKWLRQGEIKCYENGYDFKANFKNITIPIAIIFGDHDILANVKSTRSIYRDAQSNYLLCRPVRGNSHIELTMGHDIRQICYDVKNLMDYAIKHRVKKPSLPRKSYQEIKEGYSQILNFAI